MSQGWEDHEPAPLEFFHSKLMDAFHSFRKKKGNQSEVMVDGSDINRMIAKAKMATYEKYPKQVNDKAIPKTEI